MKKSEKENQSVALKAGVWYVISSIMVKMVSVITTPIFTRLLSTDEYGTVSTFTSWYSLFLVIYSIELSRSIGRAKIDYPDKLDDYIGAQQLLSLIISVALSVIIFLFLKPFSDLFALPEIGTVFLLLYLIAAPTINFVQSGYRYKYKYKQNIAIAWYIALGTAILSLILILCTGMSNDVARMAGLALPSVALSIFFWIKALREGHVKANIEYWKYGLAISLPMILHAISMNILAQSDRIVISKYFGATDVAYYSLVRNFALLLVVVTDAINQAWQPWFHDNFHAGKEKEIKKNTSLLTILMCYIGLASIAVGPEAIYILGGAEYAQAVDCLVPMVLGVVCQCLYTNYINIELHLKKTKYASIGTVTAAALNLGLNLIFVPLYGYAAAAYTTFVSYLVLLVMHFIITRRILKVKLYNDKFLFCAMFMTSVVAFGVSMTYTHTVLRYCVIGLGFISFLVIFRQYVISFLKKGISKVKGIKE